MLTKISQSNPNLPKQDLAGVAAVLQHANVLEVTMLTCVCHADHLSLASLQANIY